MSVKLIAFDLDGTLLDDGKKLTQENLRALTAAAEKGILLVPATGRIYKGIPEFIRELPFIRYYILCNGASVYDAFEDRTIYRCEIPAEDAVKVCEYMDTLPVIYDCYQNGWGLMSRDMYERIEEFVFIPGIVELMRRSREPVDDLKTALRRLGQGVEKLQMQFLDMELKKEVLSGFGELFPELLATSSLPQNIEINHRDANKGAALSGLCRHLGVDIRDSVAFGDGSNDLTMIRAAGTGVAMANAEPSVLAAADRVTDTNNNSGVAKVIRELL